MRARVWYSRVRSGAWSTQRARSCRTRQAPEVHRNGLLIGYVVTLDPLLNMLSCTLYMLSTVPVSQPLANVTAKHSTNSGSAWTSKAT